MGPGSNITSITGVVRASAAETEAKGRTNFCMPGSQELENTRTKPQYVRLQHECCNTLYPNAYGWVWFCFVFLPQVMPHLMLWMDGDLAINHNEEELMKMLEALRWLRLCV